MNNTPSDIIEIILKQLPIEFILITRMVCKKWFSISSSLLKNSIIDPNNLLSFCVTNQKFLLFIYSIDLLSYNPMYENLSRFFPEYIKISINNKNLDFIRYLITIGHYHFYDYETLFELEMKNFDVRIFHRILMSAPLNKHRNYITLCTTPFHLQTLKDQQFMQFITYLTEKKYISISPILPQILNFFCTLFNFKTKMLHITNIYSYLTKHLCTSKKCEMDIMILRKLFPSKKAAQWISKNVNGFDSILFSLFPTKKKKVASYVLYAQSSVQL